jgi:aminopeptidase N
VHARSWVPCQDTVALRFTYTANVRVPAGLLALMSAENPREKSVDGVYRFEMMDPIPSYLLALAAGNIEYRGIGPRTGVYSEPEMVEKAKWEFADLGEDDEDRGEHARSVPLGPVRRASCRPASRSAAWRILA